MGIIFGRRRLAVFCLSALSRIIVLFGPKVHGECAVSYVVKKNKGQCRAVIIARKISGLTVDPMTPVVQWAV